MAPVPKDDRTYGFGASDREKRARAAAARRAMGEETEPAMVLEPGQANLYELLGVEAWCSQQELQAAYRRRALQEHPDKGGDQERFDELQRAYGVLADEDRRDAYDRALQRAEDRATLVEGRPEPKALTAEKKAPVEKTAPRVGSKRAKDWLRCAAEHSGDRSGAALVSSIRLAILDAESADAAAAAAAAAAPQGGAAPVAVAQKGQREIEREQTEALFEKYRGLNDGMKKQWVSTLTGKQKQALKARAKEEEAKQMEKAKKWLGKK